ncbi:MAG: hypothetical protein QW412_01005 [Candidatus Aenigmatarchaeota archaeon]
MKGQSFLITAIIFIMVLVLIKSSIIFQQPQEETLIFFEFENLKEEVIKSVEYSVYEKENITKNLENFIEFSRSSFRRKALDFKSLILEVSVPNALESNELNISIKNLLGCEIIFLNLTFNNSAKIFESIEDGEKINTSFLFSQNQNRNYNLTIFYKTPYTQDFEELEIEVEIGKNKFLGFFDVMIEGKNIKLKDKIMKTYELPN